MLPDHVARCVYAAEQTGWIASRPLLLAIFNEQGDDGYYQIVGHNLLTNRYAYDPTELLWANNVNYLFARRQAIIDLGLWDGDVGAPADWDGFLSLAQLSDFACVKSVTFAVDQRSDQSNMNDSGFERWERDTRKLYGKHPVPGRPRVEEERDKVLARALERDPNRLTPMRPTTLLVPPRRGDYKILHKAT
jgi:hypothetical protein